MHNITYTRFHIDIDETFGDAFVFFRIHAHLGELEAFFGIGFHHFTQYLKQSHVEVSAYVEQVRRGLSGYGSKEKEVVEILLGEGFDFEGYVIAYLEQDRDRLAQEIERQAQLFSQPKTQEDAQRFMDSMQEVLPVAPLKTSYFLDELEKAILKHLLDSYPELSEGEPEDFAKLQRILVDAVPQLGVKVIDLIHAIRGRGR